MKLTEFFAMGRSAYHVTPIKNMRSIARQGLVPGYTPGVVYFVAAPGDYAPGPGLCLLRFPWPSDAKPLWISPIDPMEYLTRKIPISPDSIDALMDDGSYVRITDLDMSHPQPFRQHPRGLEKSPLEPTPPPGSISKDDL